MNVTGIGRRQLLELTTLYFSILFLESEVSHVPLLSAGLWSLALFPVVWLAVSLIALIAVLLWPSSLTSRFLQVAMVGSALIGVIGVFPHLAANNVVWSNPSSLLNPALFHGEPGPQWPLAITIGAALGYIAGYGVETDREFRDNRVGWPSWLAYALLLVGIVLCDSLATLGWGATVVVVAALVQFAITLADIWSHMTKGSAA